MSVKEVVRFEDDNSGWNDFGRAVVGVVVTGGVEVLAGIIYFSRQGNAENWVSNCATGAMPLVGLLGAVYVFTHLSNASEHEHGSFD